MQPARPGSSKKLIATIGLIVIVAVIAVGAIVTRDKKDDTVAATPTNTSTPTTTTATPAASTTSTTTATTQHYKDGDYSATGSYDSPGGTQKITIKVTLAGDKVTATSAVSGATDTDARGYQAEFISGYNSLVVGKDIDSIRLSKVSGSSLTSGGFNAALEKIKSSAKA